MPTKPMRLNKHRVEALQFVAKLAEEYTKTAGVGADNKRLATVGVSVLRSQIGAFHDRNKA